MDKINLHTNNFDYQKLLEFYQNNSTLSKKNTFIHQNRNCVKPAFLLLEGNYRSGKEIVFKKFIRDNNLSKQELKLNYFPQKQNSRHIFEDFIYTLLNIGPKDTGEKILNNLQIFCKNDDNNFLRFSLLCDFLYLTNSNKKFEYTPQEMEKFLIHEFAALLNYVAEDTFQKYGRQLVITIGNLEFINKNAVQLFFRAIEKGSFTVPVLFCLTFNAEKLFSHLKQLKTTIERLISNKNNNVCLFNIKEKEEEFTGDYINESIPLTTNAFKKEQLISNSFSSLMNAEELLNIYNISNGYIEDYKDYDQLVLSKLETIDKRCKIILDLLIFFEGKIFIDFFPFLFPKENETKTIIFELERFNCIDINNKVISITSFRLLDLLKANFNEQKFIDQNLEKISNLFRLAFKATKKRYLSYLIIFLSKLPETNPNDYLAKLLQKYEKENYYPESLEIINLFLIQETDFSARKLDLLRKKFKFLFKLEHYQLLIDNLKKLLQEKAVRSSSKFLVELYFYLGRSQASVLQPAEAEKNFFKAYSIAKELKEKRALAKIEKVMADFFKKQNNEEKAENFYKYAIENYKATKDEKNISDVYYSLGKFYYLVGKYESAQDNLQLALVFYAKKKDIDLPYGRILFLLGRLNVIRKNYKIAEEFFLKASAIFEQFADYQNLIDIYFASGELYYSTANLHKASTYLQKSLDLDQRIYKTSSYIKILYFLAKHSFYSHNLEKCRINLTKGLQLAQVNNCDIEFFDFMELTGDINFIEKKYIIAERCYRFVLKKYRGLHYKSKFPTILFKLAELYSETGKDQKSTEILQMIKNKEELSYLLKDNEFTYNNMLIRNSISSQKFKETDNYIEIQQNLIKSKEISLRDKVGFYTLISHYSFILDDFEKGENFFSAAVDLCRKNNLLMEEITTQLTIADFLYQNGFKRDTLKCLSSLLKNTEQIKSNYLQNMIIKKIYSL